MFLRILSLLLALVVTRVVWRRWKYDLHKVPSPPGVPLLGHTLEFVYGQPSYQLSQWLGGCLKQLGHPKLMRVDVLGASWLIVTDVNTIKDVMLSRTAPFPKYNVGKLLLLLLGNAKTAKTMVVTSYPTPYVKAVRRVYTTAFQSSNLKRAMPKLNKVIGKLIGVIDSKREAGPIELQELCVRLTLDAIGVVAFDSNLSGLDGCRDIYGLMLKVGYIMGSRFKNPLKEVLCHLFPKSAGVKKENAIVDKLTAEWDKLTKEILDKGDPVNGEEPIWSTLRSLKDPETNKPLPYESLRSEVGTVVLGGMDTTGHQLGWIFAILASYPRVVERLLAELKENGLYGLGAREVTFEDLGELTYLTATIKESMRIANTTQVHLMRFVPKDMTILGYRVPKGTQITYPGFRAITSEDVWKEPHVFRPERWLTDEDMSQKLSFSFALGPRDCAGQRLAMLEMRLVILKLITRYEFSPTVPLEEVFKKAKDGFVVEVDGGVWLNVRPRSQVVS